MRSAFGGIVQEAGFEEDAGNAEVAQDFEAGVAHAAVVGLAPERTAAWTAAARAMFWLSCALPSSAVGAVFGGVMFAGGGGV